MEEGEDDILPIEDSAEVNRSDASGPVPTFQPARQKITPVKSASVS